MGGRLWVEGEVGVGSAFHFTARFGRADSLLARAPAELPSHRSGSGPPLRILLAEDNPVNVKVSFNQQAVLSRLGGDASLLREVAQIFLEDCPRLLDDLRRGVERGDTSAVKAAAHAIKGTVALFSAEPALEAAVRLEHMGSEGDLTELATAARVLEAEVARLTTALSAVASGPPA